MQKIIPIYRKLETNKREATIFLDTESKCVFKTVYVKNDYKFWVSWALILVLLRSIKTFHLPITNPIMILFIMFLFVISGMTGIYRYKTTIKNKKEV